MSSIPEEFQEDRIETIRYKPHDAGGYAVSRVFSSKIRRAPNDLRALAREYLLEHIRRGWPYSDEFYRSDSEFYTTEISKNSISKKFRTDLFCYILCILFQYRFK